MVLVADDMKLAAHKIYLDTVKKHVLVFGTL